MTARRLHLTESQRNSLLVGFKYIDRLLTEAVAAMDPQDSGAVFTPVVPDVTPHQRKAVAEETERLRRLVRKALDICAIAVPQPEIDAVWNLHTALTTIEITLEEMGPRGLRGYGEVGPETEAGIETMLAEIRAAVGEFKGRLLSPQGGRSPVSKVIGLGGGHRTAPVPAEHLPRGSRRGGSVSGPGGGAP